MAKDINELELLKAKQKQLKIELKLQEKKNAEIRDQMAMERALFANERTFMAYIRTAMTLLLAGLSMIKFFDDSALDTIGAIFIPVGLIVSGLGLYRFLKKQKKITSHISNYGSTSDKHAQFAKSEKQIFNQQD